MVEHLGSDVLFFFGGMGREVHRQIYGPPFDICVACPGRLVALLEFGQINLDRVTFFVLDEADRLLEQSFGSQINGIVSQLRPDRQTLMFSATFEDKALRKLAMNICTQMPVHINVGNEGLKGVKTTRHIFKFPDNPASKLQIILSMMAKIVKTRVLIFCNAKLGVDELCMLLRREGLVAHRLHGDIGHERRRAVMSDFRNGEAEVVVATDVLARGIDVPNIDMVINYDFPKTFETFVHRSGRTGRAGAVGHCITFLLPHEIDRFKEHLCSFLQMIPGHPIPRQLEWQNHVPHRQTVCIE